MVASNPEHSNLLYGIIVFSRSRNIGPPGQWQEHTSAPYQASTMKGVEGSIPVIITNTTLSLPGVLLVNQLSYALPCTIKFSPNVLLITTTLTYLHNTPKS